MTEPREIAPSAEEVLPGLWHWRISNSTIGGPTSSSQALLTREGLVLIDPVHLDERALGALPRPTATLLTARCHQRSAWRYRRELGAEVWLRVLRSSRVYMRFAEFWFEFVKGMPELGAGRGSRDIVARWGELYGKLFEQLVGCPGVATRRHRPVFPWLSLYPLAPVGSASMWPGQSILSMWMAGLQSMMPGGRGGDGSPDAGSLLGEVMGETIGKAFASGLPGMLPPAELARHTRDVYRRFHDALPAIYRLFYSAGLDALSEFLGRVREAGLDTIASKPLREIYRSWWTANENAFLRLFQTPEFGRAVNEVMARSLQLKARSEDLAAEWCRKAAIPARADFDELVATVHELRRQVRRQAEEIESLQERRPAAAAPRRSRR